MSKADYEKIYCSIVIALILLSVFARVRVPHVARAAPGTPPQFRNVGPANGTSIDVGENLTLYAQGYDDTGLDWAWLSTNETGTWKNYTQLWSDWQASGSNPIVDGDSLFGSGYWTEDSKVLKVDGTYYMFITSGSAMSTMEIYMLNSSSLTGPWSIMNNSDPIIHQSTSGWDEGQLRVVCVTYYDGTYYLYYMATDASSKQSIGVATTSDAEFPTGWTKYSGNPILTPTGTGWESAGVYSLCIRRIGPSGNEWYGHYTARTSSYIWALGICYGSSPYGPFTRHPDNPILEREVGEWDNKGVPRVDFIKIGNTIYGAYESANVSGGPPDWDFQVGEYSGEITDSILNVTFSKNPNNPIIPGDAGSALQTANPHWWYENGTRYLFVGSCGQGTGPTWRYIDLFSSPNITKHGSPVDMNNVTESWTWSNFTWSNSSITAGTAVQWKIYYSDTDGNVNGTAIHSFKVKAPEYDYADLDASDVDSSADKGTHSNFDNEKACDSSYDTLSEGNTGGFGIMSYRKNITINPNYVDGDLNNFPVLIDIYDSDLHNDVQSNGDDIMFNDTSGNQLDHEIELFDQTYNTTHAHLVGWVRANLTGDSDTVIQMLYGNPTCGSQGNPTGVWDSNFEGVWHMNQVDASDSTSNNNSGTEAGGVTQTSSGKVDGADSFDGSNDYIKILHDNSLDLVNSFTIELWMKPAVLTQTNRYVLSKLSGASDNTYSVLWEYTDNQIEFYSGAYTGDAPRTGSGITISDTNSHYICYAYNGSIWKGFRDNTNVFSLSKNFDLSPTNDDLFFGDLNGGTTYNFNGVLDEIRISNIGRSTVWINTTYYCIHYQTSFRNIGNEETGAPTNYELDLEVQWTNVNYTRTYEELCIKTGTFSGSEDIQVRIWDSTDSSWAPIMNLTANQWNNVSVMSYLTESTFTVQFLGGAESGDTGQDFWNIDCSLIHTWGQVRLCVAPPLTEKTSDDVCTTFEVNVTIGNVQDLWGFEFNLTWDNSLITLANVDFNTTLDNMWGPSGWFVNESMNITGPGYHKLAAVSISTGFATTEATPMATLTFHVEGPICNSMKETLIHFETHKLSDSTAQSIPHTVEDGTYRITGQTPTLQMSPTSVTCRKFCENFTITINASDICNAENFEFEIRYNTTLLNYVNVTWNAWGSGNMAVAEANGNITGSTSGSLKTGNLTLITITFHAAYYHIWKDLPDWTNNLNGTIYFQWANLSYPDAPDLRYEKGILYEINMDPIEVVYTFAPIQGDIDNDGDVDVVDLRTVAFYYDQEDDEYNLTGDSVIDIFDLVVIAANFDYEYDA